VEIIITITISGILAAAVGSILVSAQTSWLKNTKEATIADDMRYAQSKIGYNLRSATTDNMQILGGGNRLRFKTRISPNWHEVRMSGSDLVYRTSAGDETILRDVANLNIQFADPTASRSVLFNIVVISTTNFASNATTRRSLNFVVTARGR
jgi:hypothetical protein